MISSIFRAQQRSAQQVPQKLLWYAKFEHSGKLQNEVLPDSGLEICGIDCEHSDNFLIAGDIWLSNRLAIEKEHGIEQSLTDAQAILRLWEMHQKKALSMLQGSFAFLLFERKTKKLRLIRDPIGTKNLYFGKTAGTYFVGARIKAISPFLSKDIDEIALRDYLCCAFVPGARTMFEAISEIRPGEIVSLPENKSRQFWSIREDFLEHESESLDWHSAKLRDLLNEVVSEYLPAGQDVGCYLSGGIDSSAIAALANKLHDKNVHCYSIHFGSETPNELEWSEMVARHCNMTQHIIEIKPDDMWNLHPQVISMLDDPIGDPLTVPNMILAQKAEKITPLILNGEGGDPCFGGPKNQPMMLASLYRDRAAIKDEIEASYLASFQKCKTDLPRLLNQDIWSQVKEKDSVFAEELSSPGHYVNKFFLINTKYKGADQILSKVNNITSCFGIAGRSPLFDRRIVEASLRIPPQHKLKGTQEKAVLKNAVKDLLPDAILQRPKSGMMVPVQLGFRKHWQKQARRLLLDRKARIREFLNIQLLSSWLDYKDDVWSRYGVKLWLICALELWLQDNV